MSSRKSGIGASESSHQWHGQNIFATVGSQQSLLDLYVAKALAYKFGQLPANTRAADVFEYSEGIRPERNGATLLANCIQTTFLYLDERMQQHRVDNHYEENPPPGYYTSQGAHLAMAVLDRRLKARIKDRFYIKDDQSVGTVEHRIEQYKDWVGQLATAIADERDAADDRSYHSSVFRILMRGDPKGRPERGGLPNAQEGKENQFHRFRDGKSAWHGFGKFIELARDDTRLEQRARDLIQVAILEIATEQRDREAATNGFRNLADQITHQNPDISAKELEQAIIDHLRDYVSRNPSMISAWESDQALDRSLNRFARLQQHYQSHLTVAEMHDSGLALEADDNLMHAYIEELLDRYGPTFTNQQHENIIGAVPHLLNARTVEDIQDIVRDTYRDMVEDIWIKIPEDDQNRLLQALHTDRFPRMSAERFQQLDHLAYMAPEHYRQESMDRMRMSSPAIDRFFSELHHMSTQDNVLNHIANIAASEASGYLRTRAAAIVEAMEEMDTIPPDVVLRGLGKDEAREIVHELTLRMSQGEMGLRNLL